jgi:hypothetical protein
MPRALLANLLFIALPILLMVSGIVLAARGRTMERCCLGILLVALPAGITLYITAGIAAGRMRGDGYFYGVPFGGYGLSDNISVGISITIWICLVIAILAGILRRRT